VRRVCLFSPRISPVSTRTRKSYPHTIGLNPETPGLVLKEIDWESILPTRLIPLLGHYNIHIYIYIDIHIYIYIYIYTHLLRPESSLISCNILPGISNHNGVLLVVEWDKICRQPNSPGVPQNRCFRLPRLSSGKF
jgi:hypothetical protein